MAKSLRLSTENTPTKAMVRYILVSGSGALDMEWANKLFWTELFMRDNGSLVGLMVQVSFITQKQDTPMRVNSMMILFMVKDGSQKMVQYLLVRSTEIRGRVKDMNAMVKATYILVLSKMA